tara:strand:- start:982 stop:1182 length:201 start_codon:yes stop_codon:yes gene_type:complete
MSDCNITIKVAAELQAAADIGTSDQFCTSFSELGNLDATQLSSFFRLYKVVNARAAAAQICFCRFT